MVWTLSWAFKWPISWRRTIEGRKASEPASVLGALFRHLGCRSTLKRCNIERPPWEREKRKSYDCFYSQAFLIWVITMATNVFINNQQPQPQPPTLIAVHSNQWSTGICDCFDDLNVCKSASLQRVTCFPSTETYKYCQSGIWILKAFDVKNTANPYS